MIMLCVGIIIGVALGYMLFSRERTRASLSEEAPVVPPSNPHYINAGYPSPLGDRHVAEPDWTWTRRDPS